jgi:septum formation protein
VSLWRAAKPLVLASASPIRRQLLESAGISVEIRPADIDERQVEAQAGNATPEQVAELLALTKARAVAAQHPGRMVLGADQTLAFEGRVFTKPDDRAGARAQLQRLRGHTHALHAAVVILDRDTVVLSHVASAHLTMRECSDAFLDHYLDEAGDKVLGSVGGYQLEGLGVQLFEKIDGDHTTILGLPLLPLVAFLRRHGCLQE